MNGLEEVQKIVKNFIEETKKEKQKIAEIEQKRTELAKIRNEKKNANIKEYEAEIFVLGKEIANLGNQSQNIQNEIDSKFNEKKKVVNLTIDNFVAENIRKIRKIFEEKEELEEKVFLQQERNAKYELQKQDFYERFGRVPELSEKAKREDEIQDRQCLVYKEKIQELNNLIENTKTELEEFVKIKNNFKNKNWSNIIVEEKEEIIIEEFAEICTENFETLENLIVEEIEPIQDIVIEELETLQDIAIEDVHTINEQEIDKFEKIFEEIKEEQENNNKLFEEKIKILNIIAKIEDGEVVYKVQISNGDEMKVYPARLSAGNALLKDAEIREDIKEILINYTVEENKILDKKVIGKIDPTICEVLNRFAKKYEYDARNLIYSYAMSFSNKINYRIEIVPIIYNFSYIGTTNLSKKEKKNISKICRNASKNERIDVIGCVTKLGKIRYALKRIIATNKVRALSEGKF